MMLVSYFAGQRVYRIPYDVPRLLLMPLLAAGLWYLSTLLPFHGNWKLLVNTGILLVFVGSLVFIIRNELKGLLHPPASSSESS